MDERRKPAPAPASPNAADALLTGRAVLELIHAANATRRAEPAPPGAGHAAVALSPHAVRASIHLYQHGALRVSDLARGLGVSPGWASRLVDELESVGLVDRHPDPGDRRVTWIELTPESVRQVEGEYRWRGDAVERAIEPFDARERAAIVAFLRALTDELLVESREQTSRHGRAGGAGGDGNAVPGSDSA